MKKKLLLIDDEVDLVEMTKFQLQASGFEVETAYNGEEGLDKVESFKPDLILLDINMPKMGGIEFYNRVCGFDQKPAYPILVLTARANMEQLFKEFDVDGFMTKPFEIDGLVQEIKSIIRKRTREELADQDRLFVRKVCIIENDLEILTPISTKLLTEGYILSAARTGTAGIETVTRESPDLVLVNLRQKDISGDLIILKLKRMDETSDLVCVLYTKEGATDMGVMEEMRHKPGIDHFLETAKPQEILDFIQKMN